MKRTENTRRISTLTAWRWAWLVCMFLAAALLSGCGSSQAEKATSTPAATQVPPATVTPTPEPTATAAPPLAVLLAPPGADAGQAAALEALLAEMAKSSGMRFKVLPGLGEADLADAPQIVVVMGPDPGVAGLAAKAPAAQFLAVGVPGVQAGGNLSVISDQAARPDQQGFLAGYIAAMLTRDWRTGIIYPQGSAEGQAAQQGFVSGVVYYCGLCRSAVPPFFQYPLYSEVPAGAGQAELQAAADYLLQYAIKTVYLAPGAQDPALVDYLVKAGVNLIGPSAPPEGVQAQWIASIQADPLEAVRQAWPSLAEGQGGLQVNLPLGLAHANQDLFSAGKQEMAREMLQDLTAGYIGTGAEGQAATPSP